MQFSNPAISQVNANFHRCCSPDYKKAAHALNSPEAAIMKTKEMLGGRKVCDDHQSVDNLVGFDRIYTWHSHLLYVVLVPCCYYR
jgi:hypothetical protein